MIARPRKGYHFALPVQRAARREARPRTGVLGGQVNASRGFFILAAWCAAGGGLSCASPKASIEDFVLGGRAELLAVDGQAVERAQSQHVTVVPVALVKPGRHAFLVKMAASERGVPADSFVVSATVVAGRHYHFEARDGMLLLVENGPKH